MKITIKVKLASQFCNFEFPEKTIDSEAELTKVIETLKFILEGERRLAY